MQHSPRRRARKRSPRFAIIPPLRSDLLPPSRTKLSTISAKEGGSEGGHSGTYFKLPFRSDNAGTQLRSVPALNERINSEPLEGFGQLPRIRVRYCETLEMAPCGGISGGMDCVLSPLNKERQQAMPVVSEVQSFP